VALADTRVAAGCADANDNASDFTSIAPAPQSSTSPIAACGCVDRNESGALLEADYCNVQFPLSLNVPAGSMNAVFGRIYEAGVTDAAAVASPLVRAQVGYGPPTANPEYESGWSWTNAAYNAGFIDPSNDEYQATFTAPASGSYRYAYRFSLDRGVTWTVCDQNAAPDFGAGSNPGLTLDFSSLSVLTVP
jgi:hypothetical protein